MTHSNSRLGTVTALLAILLTPLFANGDDDLEATVCGPILERAAFALWSAAAGKPNPELWKTVRGAEPVSHKTRDGRTLSGYRINATARPVGSRPKPAFLLFAQGNAMLADRLLHDLGRFAVNGVDVYVYDFRGYGNSEGERRLKAIVSDYQELTTRLNAAYPGGGSLYGVSFGGLVFLNVIGRGAAFERAVIDSSPSRVSNWGCPEAYDPVVHVPADASRILVVSGRQDAVVKPADQTELLAATTGRGGRTLVSDDFAHPFMDRFALVHDRRQNAIKDFLFEHR